MVVSLGKSSLLLAVSGLAVAAVTLAAPAAPSPDVATPRFDLLAPPDPDGDVPERSFDVPASRMVLPGRVAAAAPPVAASSHRNLPAPSPITLRDDFLFTGSAPEGDAPTGLVFTPDGSEILVAHRNTKNLVVFDAATRQVTRTIALSGSPHAVAVTSDGQYAVTANVYEDTVSIVTLATGVETATIPVGEQPGVVRITADGTTAVVGNTVSSELSVIDIASATELRRMPNAGFVASVSINFEPGVIAVAFSQFELAGNTAVVHPDYYADRIRVYDIGTGTETTLVCDDSPRGVAITPNGTTAVVSHTANTHTISVVDVATPTITKTISLGESAGGPICIRPDGGKALVAVLNACRVVDLVTDSVGPQLSTASTYDLRTTADGLYAVCIGYYGSVIDFTTDALLTHTNAIVSTPLGAVSPAGPRAAMVATTFGEEMVVVNTNGAGGYTEGVVPSGPPMEADKTRSAAVSADGTRAVTLGILGDTASIIDLATGTVDAVVEVGDRPSEVEITPDGTLAVVANLDSTFASVIDLQTYAVTNIAISRRASQVEISPDGHYAYLCVVADGDGVWRIDLDTLSVAGTKIGTANMMSVGFMYNQTSGMTLSHDGSVLAVCGTWDDVVSLVDTTAWSLIKNVTVGDYPVRALFADDDSSIYVTCANDDRIDVLSNAGAGSAVIGSVAVGDNPFEMAIDADRDTLYVLNYKDKNVGVVDLLSNATIGTIGLTEYPAGMHLDAGGRFLYVATGTWSVTLGPGPNFSIAHEGYVDVIGLHSRRDFTIDTGLPPAMMAFDANDATGLIPSPFGDGATRLRVWGR